MIAVSESTPGPIMVNLATYIGNSQAGFLGALIATIAVVLPAFLIIILVMVFFKTTLQNKYVQVILGGLKPCVVGIVLATGLYIILVNCFGTITEIKIDLQAIIITILLVISMIGYKQITKKKLTPIMLIILSAISGIVIYGI